MTGRAAAGHEAVDGAHEARLVGRHGGDDGARRAGVGAGAEIVLVQQCLSARWCVVRAVRRRNAAFVDAVAGGCSAGDGLGVAAGVHTGGERRKADTDLGGAGAAVRQQDVEQGLGRGLEAVDLADAVDRVIHGAGHVELHGHFDIERVEDGRRRGRDVHRVDAGDAGKTCVDVRGRVNDNAFAVRRQRDRKAVDREQARGADQVGVEEHPRLGLQGADRDICSLEFLGGKQRRSVDGYHHLGACVEGAGIVDGAGQEHDDAGQRQGEDHADRAALVGAKCLQPLLQRWRFRLNSTGKHLSLHGTRRLC